MEPCDYRPSMDNVNIGSLDPRKQELLEARFYGRVRFKNLNNC